MDVDVFLLAGQFPGMSHAEALEAALEFGVAAEVAGFTGAWMAEHHFISYGVCPSAVAFASHLLGRTTRLEVGTAATILSNRHPVALAEEAVVLDILSGGRFRLGVARGGPWVDLEVFGTGLQRYERGFPEALDLLLQWLSGAPRVAAQGEFFDFRQVAVVPRPVRPPQVWVAATSESTVNTAAARGLPLLLGMHVSDADKRRTLDQYAEVAAAHGHDASGVPHASAHLAYVADSRQEAERVLRAAIPIWLERGVGEYVRLDGGPGQRRDPQEYVNQLLRVHPVGTAEECAERLAASAATTGVRRALLMVEGAGDRRRTLENIARLGAEVLPRLRTSIHDVNAHCSAAGSSEWVNR